MQQGKIVASGSHQELLQKSDIYKRLAGKIED
jgi:ABC-type multidrug transport system fused ATPase/permease subunit